MNTMLGADREYVTPSRNVGRMDLAAIPHMPLEVIESSPASDADSIVSFAQERVRIGMTCDRSAGSRS